MAVSNISLNNKSFASFFQESILDNNGIAVTDINAGLYNLFKTFNENAANMKESQRYFVNEIEAGYPDLLAKHSILGDQEYWWWILLINLLENPMEDIKANWVYSILSAGDIDNFINISNENNSSNNNSRIGTVVELN